MKEGSWHGATIVQTIIAFFAPTRPANGWRKRLTPPQPPCIPSRRPLRVVNQLCAGWVLLSYSGCRGTRAAGRLRSVTHNSACPRSGDQHWVVGNDNGRRSPCSARRGMVDADAVPPRCCDRPTWVWSMPQVACRLRRPPRPPDVKFQLELVDAAGLEPVEGAARAV